jgi:hypothetical protein
VRLTDAMPLTFVYGKLLPNEDLEPREGSPYYVVTDWSL